MELQLQAKQQKLLQWDEESALRPGVIEPLHQRAALPAGKSQHGRGGTSISKSGLAEAVCKDVTSVCIDR